MPECRPTPELSDESESTMLNATAKKQADDTLADWQNKDSCIL